MKVPIFRSEFIDPDLRAFLVPILSFEPIEGILPAPDSAFCPDGNPGSGPDPWTWIGAPEGSRVEPRPCESDCMIPPLVEPMLVLPDGTAIEAVEAFRRFGDPDLVRSEDAAGNLPMEPTEEPPMCF